MGRKGTVDLKNDYPLEQAIATTQQLLVAKDEMVLDEQYPLMRQPKTVSKIKDINILIVLLEGWHPYYIDSLSGNQFGVTPVFDEIVKNGVNFTNAYAMGLRSIIGYSAVMASAPLVPGLPVFGYGLELTTFYRLPAVLAHNGWSTFFAQTSKRGSYRLCALSSYLGAQGSYGNEDMKELLDYIDPAPFGYDYDGLMFAADVIDSRKTKNFMGIVFTGITHSPFARTLPQFDKYQGKTWDDGFKNTLYFADWSIGELIKRAKKEGWFDNTVFIIKIKGSNLNRAINSSLYVNIDEIEVDRIYTVAIISYVYENYNGFRNNAIEETDTSVLFRDIVADYISELYPTR